MLQALGNTDILEALAKQGKYVLLLDGSEMQTLQSVFRSAIGGKSGF